jgi:hypothetical protein
MFRWLVRRTTDYSRGIPGPVAIGSLRTRNLRQQDEVLVHCLDIENFRGDCFIRWVFEIQCDSVSDEFLVLGGGRGNNNKPESGGDSIGLGIRRDGYENIPQVQRLVATYRWQKLVL